MFPILSSLIILPLIGSLFLIFIRSSEKNTSLKYVALFITFANFFLSLYLWKIFDPSISTFQFVENRIWIEGFINYKVGIDGCLLYTSPSPRDLRKSRMPSSA